MLAERLDTAVLLDPVSASPLLDDYYTGEANTCRRNSTANSPSYVDVLHPRRRPTGSAGVADFTVLRTAPFAEFLADPGDRDDRARRDASVDRRRHRVSHVLVLLDAEPETLFERVRTRDRDAETELTLDHLVELRRHFTELALGVPRPRSLDASTSAP